MRVNRSYRNIVGFITGTALAYAFPGESFAAASGSRAFSYSGASELFQSPSGGATLRVEVDPVARGGEHRKFLTFTRKADGRSIRHEFERDVDGEWAPAGDTAFINDYEGSNYADCLLPSIGEQPRFISLDRILRRDPRSGPRGPGVKPIETPDNSDHYYLNCVKWVDDDSVVVRIYGNTDAGGWFQYRLRYYPAKKHFDVLSNEEAKVIGGVDWLP